MRFIENNIKWIMLITGLITCTMVLALIAPRMALEQTFGQSLEGPLAEIVVRSWGAVITLIGAMLVFGAFWPEHRSLVLVIAAVSKLIFVGLVLSIGTQFLGKAGLTIAFDGATALIFLLYLLGSRNRSIRV
ncbi:hypothetical protein LJY18_04055 [Pseudomonas sp. MMS21-TM103]|uniref:hypothetical protein n=1 Tax=Pseudomonas sp. MMS21 TM103 TaxID=2886506 RepID=UPI001EDE7FC8|nr:hypothetical protein [Pseudomonas sp. MMS21 TM103]MCG4452478.1 hypothetical protein [Pseudomonas sp. MMS21 TM103]